MIKLFSAVVIMSSVFLQYGYAMDLDDKLELVKKVYKLEAKNCSPSSNINDNRKKYLAGKALFETTALSGNRDISCSTCHLKKFGFADGLPIAVGVGGKGDGVERYENDRGALVQRNTFTLIGRGAIGFKAFFWDGKVQVEGNKVVTQFGNYVKGFIDPLSAAALLPLVDRDEFIGETSYLFSNEIQDEVRNKLYYEKYLAVSKAIRTRLVSPENPNDEALSEIISAAGIDIKKLELVDIGNLLSKFISIEFKCNESAWDSYLNGKKDALTSDQKKGAVLFYGKGRCATCHDGSLLSDFEYHSIGLPQGNFGPYSQHRDIGRAGVTNRAEDLYKFRTPPLIGVRETSPYGHNGSFKTLREITIQHINPLAFYIDNNDYYSSDYYIIGKLLESRSSILSTIDIKDDEEIDQIIKYLEVL